MKQITYEQFKEILMSHPHAKVLRVYTDEERSDREMAIHRARRIFVNSGLTDNITIAFQLYQDIFAEREREIFVNAMSYGSFMDKYERPQCPSCQSDMKFRIVPLNDEGIKTQLVCPNEECDTVLDSKLSLEEWMGILKKV